MGYEPMQTGLKAVDAMTASLPLNDADTYVLAARPGARLYAGLDTTGNLALDTELSFFGDQNLSTPVEFDDNDGASLSSVIAGAMVHQSLRSCPDIPTRHTPSGER